MLSNQSILHVCGGDPKLARMQEFQLMVFSTCVEVILIQMLSVGFMHSILHVCGGDPDLTEKVASITTYSPRVWR